MFYLAGGQPDVFKSNSATTNKCNQVILSGDVSAEELQEEILLRLAVT